MKLFKFIAAVILLFAFEANATTSVLLIGDSITRSFTNGGGAVSGTGWPETDVGSYSLGLAQSLGSDYVVTNVGCSGSASFQWQPNWVPANFPYGGYPTYCNGVLVNVNLFHDYVTSPDIAVVMLGTNDVFWWETTPVNFNSYMQNVVNGLFSNGVSKVILMTTPPIPGQPALKGVYLGVYRQNLLDMCNNTPNLYCIDTNTILSDTNTNFTGITAHPNAIGHEAIRQALNDRIVALPEPSTITLLASGILGLALISRKRYVR